MIPKKTQENKAEKIRVNSNPNSKKAKGGDGEKYVPTRNFTKEQMNNKLPPAEFDANGRPILNIDGIDDKNLEKTMKDFFS